MIKGDRVFHLNTKDTSYIFRVLENGYLENLHYGNKIRECKDYSLLYKKSTIPEGNSISYSKEFPNINLDNICLEYSGIGKGDLRESPIEIVFEDGTFVTDFRFLESRSYTGKKKIPGLPSSYSIDDKCDTLEIDLLDEESKVMLTLYYHTFYESNVITRSVKVSNLSEKNIALNKVMSMQLDIPNYQYSMITFSGTWAREMQKNIIKLESGIYINDSKGGTSSNRHNPFVIFKGKDTGENHGSCYGLNLIYSGNHIEVAEVNYANKLRIQTGINPYCFNFNVAPGESFYTPEAVLSYSKEGLNGLSNNMHKFVKDNIIPVNFKNKERPVLINSWEAHYFEFDDKKLISLAKEAANLGIELFVLDDGWFGERNDDTSSLGDWYVNESKLSKGLQGLCKEINSLGMEFGLWLEPEMISENSKLYKNHPDWAINIPYRKSSVGRNQFILDLSRSEVREYLIEAITKVLESANITYVKWDMNRNFSDMYSKNLSNQGELFHKYVLGLYEVIEAIQEKFPNILFEGCSAGGNRFDLGMLCYMPQIWASDNTDASERIKIQNNLSYGYPQCTFGAHVSDCPNHQTLRNISLETRFNVAAFGLLGYELNLKSLDSLTKKAIKDQIEFYKKYRNLLQFGELYRVENVYYNVTTWIIIEENKGSGILMYYQDKQISHPNDDILRTYKLSEDTYYKVSIRKQKINIKAFGNLINHVTPIEIKNGGMIQHFISKVYNYETENEEFFAYGDMLNEVGFMPKEQFSGCGVNENVRLMGDYSSRLFLIRKVHE
ncbi:MAG: alpha-galactosidase [Clostridium sartagoforme]|nr:alpha-galactosidase [Clostridium sartagoforme]